MSQPLVSVICTAYNHDAYIVEALDSVAGQVYPELELIIIDNGSKDDTAIQIKNWLAKNENKLQTNGIFHKESMPYCKVFNQALALSKGKYLIDLAGDDVLYPGHVDKAVSVLKKSDGSTAVYFCNAYLSNPQSGSFQTFYKIDQNGILLRPVPQGNIFVNIVQNYMLCSATMVYNNEILKKEGGYDENLSYEDFDIMVRLSRKYAFVFYPHIGVCKRILSTSYAAKQYQSGNSIMLPSTLKVCQKIKELIQNDTEKKALQKRVLHEIKHALASANFETAGKFLKLAREINTEGLSYFLYRIWYRSKLDVSGIYQWYAAGSRRF